MEGRRTKSAVCDGGPSTTPLRGAVSLPEKLGEDLHDHRDCLPPPRLLSALSMQTVPETSRVATSRVACDGATEIPGGAALGHPRVYLEIDEKGYVDCGYCDRRFILIGGVADEAH